jgi:hypothetical protein
MVRLYADENFPSGASRRLRLLGHDVLTVQQTNVSKYGDGKSDDDVLRIAMDEGRAVVTLNCKHFAKLAAATTWHEGIILCAVDPDTDRLGRKIDAQIRDAIGTNGRLTGRVVHVV